MCSNLLIIAAEASLITVPLKLSNRAAFIVAWQKE
jgi:hypothetical protein